MKSWLAMVLIAVGFTANAQSGRVVSLDPVPGPLQVVIGEELLLDVMSAVPVPGGELRNVTGARHGSAAIVDGQVRYVPAPDAVEGVDRLVYTVAIGRSRLAVGQVQIDLVAPPPAIELRLSGSINGLRPTCEVFAYVGAQAFQGCLDASGRYQIDLLSTDHDALVRIEAEGASVAAGVTSRWVSLTRGLATLSALAEDGVLDEDRHAALTVTAFTTAHAGIITAMHGGEVEDPTVVRALNPSIHPDRVAAEGLHFEARVRGLQSTYGLWGDLMSGAHRFAAFPADVAGSWVSLAPGMPGAIGRQLAFGWSLGGKGQGQLSHPWGGFSPSIGWTRDAAGHIELDAPPILFLQPTAVMCIGKSFDPIEMLHERRHLRLIRLVHGDGRDFLVHVEDNRLSPDQPLDPDCTTLPGARTFTRSMQALAAEDILGFDDPAALGRVATQMAYPAAALGDRIHRSVAVFDFQSGHLEASGFEPEFVVTRLDDGRLQLRVWAEESLGGGEAVVELARAQTDRHGGEEWVSTVVTDQGGSVAVGALAARETDPGLFADPGFLSGRWLPGDSLGRVPEAFIPDEVPYPQAAPIEFFDNVPGQGTRSGAVFAWSIEAGQLVMQSHVVPQSHKAPGPCPADAGAGCFEFHHSWRPLSLASGTGADRLYVVEQRWRSEGGVDTVELAPQVSYYERDATH